MKRTIVALVAILAACTWAAPVCPAQALKTPKKNEVFRPEMLSTEYYPESIGTLLSTKKFGQSTPSRNFKKDYWDVYSDRDENVTYTDQKFKKALSSLSFGEKVRIAQIKGNAALVYAAPKEDIPFPGIPANADWKGWIPMENLILWDQSMVTDFGIPIRCVLASGILDRGASDDAGKLYKNPVSPKDYELLPNIPNSVFYILKTEGDKVLLSLAKELGENASNLYGWVSRLSILRWNTRLAVEPNWDPSFVEDFASKGVTSQLLETDLRNESGEMLKCGEIVFRAPEHPVYVEDYYRMPGNLWRYPVYVDPRIYAGAQHSFYMPTSSAYLDESYRIQPADEDEYLLNDLNSVKVMFLLDGSRSYEPYYFALTKLFKDLRDALTGYTVDVGATFFWDEEGVRYSNFPLRSISSPEYLIDFVKSGGSRAFREDVQEPLLLSAIDTLAGGWAGFRPSANNVLIVLGGRGETAENPSVVQEDLANRLDSENISLYGIQLKNSPFTLAYRRFNDQMTGLIQGKLTARNEKAGSGQDSVMEFVREEDGVSAVRYALNSYDNPYYEQFFYGNSGVEEDRFEELMRQIFAQIALSVEANKERFAALGGGKAQVFRRVAGEIADPTGHPFFQTVADLDEDELAALMETFGKIYDDARSKSIDAKSFSDYLISKLNFFPETVTTKPEDRGIYEAFRLIEGVEAMSGKYPGPRLGDLQDPKKVTPEEFQFILDNFSFRYKKLLEIWNAPYRYTSMINGKKHFWIPLDCLP